MIGVAAGWMVVAATSRNDVVRTRSSYWGGLPSCQLDQFEGPLDAAAGEDSDHGPADRNAELRRRLLVQAHTVFSGVLLRDLAADARLDDLQTRVALALAALRSARTSTPP